MSMVSLLINVALFSRMAAKEFYKLTPIKMRAEVRGIDLKQEIPAEVIEQIKKDVTKHRILVFKNQGTVSGSRHVEISRWFGELESTFYKHPKSPHPDVFRVSNDEAEGCTGVGRTGWHIDGSFQPAPFGYSLYHMVAVPKQGNTVFAPLNEVVSGLTEEQRWRWEQLWMVSDRRGGPVHPLIYSHPLTGNKTLCFHLGMTEFFLVGLPHAEKRRTEWKETNQIMMEIHQELVKNNKDIQYSHKWEVGDFIISDNLAVGHEASPQTQLPVEQVGLRVLHRTTVKGTVPPKKNYTVEPPAEHQEL
ncbi:Hypp7203 [Branchiostoma lanceolatum]|uniref:Hypp7203 protein n=1 Tax=Branchiostoma lanceolatum TaxID=7740 RepID=A0A8J9YYB0_BRALA|nr:Hypp7203 [Branchiostoma lanceolatum]CAH1244030.1 Hypp7203 [Branchiostoma lanceolatum]